MDDFQNELEALRKDLQEAQFRFIETAKAYKNLRQVLDKNIAPFIDFPVPLYLSPPEGAPAFELKRGSAPWPVFVISIPKSGTYFLGELLSHLGIVPTHVHMWEKAFHDYRHKTIQEMIEKYNEFEKIAPFHKTARLILPGQFSVGHLHHQESNLKILEPFKSYFTHRELRACLVSYMRWMMKPGRGGERDVPWKAIPENQKRMEAFMASHGQQLLEWYAVMIGWRQESTVMQVSFETLSGDEGPAKQTDLVRRIAAHIGIDTLDDAGAQALLKQVLGSETKTWSGKRTALDDYWTPTCEMIYEKFGGPELNRKLGY